MYTPEQIQTQILTEKTNRSELAGLTNVSNTSVWFGWMFLTSTIISWFSTILDLFKSDVQKIIDSNQYGNDQWWFNKILAYQHGDLLAFINNIYQYPVIDASKQIVKFCSISTVGGIVQVKAAAEAGGQPVVLDAGQLAGLLAYCTQFRPAGIRFGVQSLQADTLKMLLNVYYNASADITLLKPAVNTAIQNFLSNLNTTSGISSSNFDGTFYVNKFIDAIQAVPGIVNDQVEVLQIAAKNGPDAYQTFTSRYKSKAGYFMIDPAYPLTAVINFIPA